MTRLAPLAVGLVLVAVMVASPVLAQGNSTAASSSQPPLLVPGFNADEPVIPGWLYALFALLGFMVILSGFLFFRWARQRA